jgi:hypothetical protein
VLRGANRLDSAVNWKVNLNLERTSWDGVWGRLVSCDVLRSGRNVSTVRLNVIACNFRAE